MSRLSVTSGAGRRLRVVLRWRGRWAGLAVAGVFGLAACVPAAGSSSAPPVVHAAIARGSTNIRVGANPTGEALSPDGSVLYVTNLTSASVSVINAGTGAVTATIKVGRDPTSVAVSPDGRRVYVADGLSDGAVSVIGAATNTVTATIPLGAGSYPQELAVSPNGRRVYVTDWGPETVSVIDTARKAVIATIPVGIHPVGVTFGPDGRRAYVANRGENGGEGSVTEIGTAGNRVLKTIRLGAATGPWEVAAVPGNRLYVTDSSSDTVSVISTISSKVTGTITVGTGPAGIAVSASTCRAFVTSPVSGSMAVIDTTSGRVVTTIRGLAYPAEAAVSPNGRRIFVTNQVSPPSPAGRPGGGTVSVVNI